MTIERKKPPISTFVERQITTGFVVSERFIEGVRGIYRPGVLQVKYANIVAGWCIEYYDKYKRAPGKDIEDIFKIHRTTTIADEATADAIEDFLISINDEYEKGETFNADYILDKAEDHFRLSKLVTLNAEIAKCIAGKRGLDGESLIVGYDRVERADAHGIDPFSSTSIVNALDDNSGQQLFKLHGELGNAIGQLERGHLMGIVGSAGIGKTWWLMYIALRALFSGLNVVFVSLEMSELQMVRRIQHWVTGNPLAKHAGHLLLPVFDCVKNQDGRCKDGCSESLYPFSIDKNQKIILPDYYEAPKNYETCTECMGHSKFEVSSWFRREEKEREALTIDRAMAKRRAVEKMSAVKGKRFKVYGMNSGEGTMQQLETYLNHLEYYEGFVADVVVTDYADKFKNDRQDYRHGINDIWEQHKGMAQRRHCLVATGSQSNTARSGKDIKQGDWAEDIRKLNLVDIGFSINQNDEDKMKNIYRCSLMKQRHDDFNAFVKITVLSMLKIGRPYLDSYIS